MTDQSTRTCSGVGCHRHATEFWAHKGRTDALGFCDEHGDRFAAGKVAEITWDASPASGEPGAYRVQFRH